jgi:hypothetical protein
MPLRGVARKRVRDFDPFFVQSFAHTRKAISPSPLPSGAGWLREHELLRIAHGSALSSTASSSDKIAASRERVNHKRVC